MASLKAERSVDVDAPVERCYAIAAELERAPEWQTALESVDVLERDGEGRPALVETVSDAKIAKVKATLRLSYAVPGEISWTQERGDVKALNGRWTFADAGAGRTRVTYALEVDPGFALGLLLRGPAEDKVREVLVGDAAAGLKARAEAG
jgi:uncharacterized membrane protein